MNSHIRHVNSIKRLFNLSIIAFTDADVRKLGFIMNSFYGKCSYVKYDVMTLSSVNQIFLPILYPLSVADVIQALYIYSD